MQFDSMRVIIPHAPVTKSLFENTIDVSFNKNYFETLKQNIDKIQTEYFWFFACFTNLKHFSGLDFKPVNKNMQVWYTTHPMGGLNKQGNVFLIHADEFREQMQWISKLKQFNLINYHADPILYQRPITKIYFKLDKLWNENSGHYYAWFVNKDLKDIKIPNFYPSFWEDQNAYTWGDTKDIMLIPNDVDWSKQINFDYEYLIKGMDMAEMPECTPLAYLTAANLTKTRYFWAVPKGVDTKGFDFAFQPDRTALPKHYVFENGIILVNKNLCMVQKGVVNV